jgi:NADH:ubiquinone oxidoreductase subunit 6 (subunit J)
MEASIPTIIFVLLSVVVIGSALFVVTTRNLFHAALMLILSFFGVAGFYVLLEVGFFAVAQVLVYIGAISILFIFAVMLTRGMMAMEPANAQAQSAAVLCIGIFIAMAAILGPFTWGPFSIGNFAPRVIGGVPWQITTEQVSPGYIEQFGRALTDPNGYALPFELASVLILLAMVGAIWVARERRPAEVMADRAQAAAEEAEDRALEDALNQPGAAPKPETAVAADSH